MISAMGTPCVQPLLSRKDAAGFLSVSLRTLDRLGIPRIKLGHSVRYKMTALNDYINERLEVSIKPDVTIKRSSRATLSGRHKKIDDANWTAKMLAPLNVA